MPHTSVQDRNAVPPYSPWLPRSHVLCLESRTGSCPELVRVELRNLGALLHGDLEQLPEAELCDGLLGGHARELGGAVQRDVRRRWREDSRLLRVPVVRLPPNCLYPRLSANPPRRPTQRFPLPSTVPGTNETWQMCSSCKVENAPSWWPSSARPPSGEHPGFWPPGYSLPDCNSCGAIAGDQVGERK